MNNENWRDKYAPKKWEDLLLPNDPTVRRIVSDLFTLGKIPKRGLILHGDGGTGKSTFLDMFRTMHPDWIEYEIDSVGNTKRDIGDLRTRLKNCSKFQANHGRYYLVWGNEISESSVDFRNGLRSVIDEYWRVAFFIFSDNYYTKLCAENPLLFNNERLLGITWDNFKVSEVEAYCINVLKQEGIDTIKNIEITKEIIARHPSKLRVIFDDMEKDCIKEN